MVFTKIPLSNRAIYLIGLGIYFLTWPAGRITANLHPTPLNKLNWSASTTRRQTSAVLPQPYNQPLFFP
jgi:hypothetical protein